MPAACSETFSYIYIYTETWFLLDSTQTERRPAQAPLLVIFCEPTDTKVNI